MTSQQYLQQNYTDLNQLRSVDSVRRTAGGGASSCGTTSKVLAVIAGVLLIGGVCAGVAASFLISTANAPSSSSTANTDTFTKVTTVTTTTATTTTATTATTTTTTTASTSATSTTSSSTSTSTSTSTTSTTSSSTSTSTSTSTTSSSTSSSTSTSTSTSSSTTSVTTTTSSSTTSTTTTTTQTTITFTAVGIYALTIPTCATWNQTGVNMGGNSNGTSGSDLRSLTYPVSIFVDNNNILYVADRDNHRILKFLPNATTGIIVAGNGTAGNEPNQLRGTKGVAIDQYGSIIVADSDNYRIQKFLANSTVGITLASNTSFSPLGQMRDLHIDVNNNIYVTDSDNNQVVKYIPYSTIGVVLAGGGASGSALNQLYSPFGNFMDANGTLYVADNGNHRVLKYTSGSLYGTIVAGINGTAGSNLSQLYGPISIIVDNNGYIYVADQGNSRVVKWTTNYAAGGVCIIGCTGTAGTAANQLSGPRDLKFDRYGNIYVTDQGNHRILKYSIILPTSTCPTTG